MVLSERSRAIGFTASVVLVAVALILAAQAFLPRPPTLSNGIVLSVVVEGPGWSISYESNETRNNTVFLFLLEAARSLHFGLEWVNYSPPLSAVFITSINSAHNGDGHRYWQFWVDVTYGTVAADLTILRGGETILWRFVAPQEG